MSDGQLAIVGVGSVGSMALWQASKLGIAPVGFEAVTPAHPRSAVGGDTRLFRMTYRGEHNLYPVLQLAERLWRQLEQESGQEILTQCGGLSIGETDGSYIPALLDSIRRTGAPHEVLPYAEMARRYPQHHLTPNECGILDRRAGFLRTDRAVLSAVDAARENGAQLIRNAPVREIREVAGGVQISTDTDRWTFDRVIVAAGFGSGTVLPPFLQRHVHTKRNFLTWFTAGDAQQFVPEAFPVFIRITGDLSLYGAPTVDKVTVKATLDGRGTPAADADTIARELTPAEVAGVDRDGPGVPTGSDPRDRPIRRVPRPLHLRLDRPAGAAARQRPHLLRDRVLRYGLQDRVGARRDRRHRGVGPGSARGRPGLPPSRALRFARLSSAAVPAHRARVPAAGHSRPLRISITRRALLSMWWRTCRTAVAVSPDSMASRITWCSARMSSECSNSRSSNDSTVR